MRMDLNRASLRLLVRAVGEAAAYDLVLWRPYLSWEEVAEVPGFDEERAAALRAEGFTITLPDDPIPEGAKRNPRS
jgi:DNA uptake protein ComE-like DNA-binding protein